MILLCVTSHQTGTGLCLNAGPIRDLVTSRLMYMHDKVSACIGVLDPKLAFEQFSLDLRFIFPISFPPPAYYLTLIIWILCSIWLLTMTTPIGCEPKVDATVQTIAPIVASDASESYDDQTVGFTYQDKADMKRIGKRQELRRNFRTLSSIAFTTCTMGTYEILLTTNTQGLIAGGSGGLFWSLCGCMSVKLF